jgi:hypothetical protein
MAIRLPRLPMGVPIIDPKTGIATAAYAVWWDQVLTEVESHITTLEVEALAASLAAATAAAAASATAANAAAATANTAATTAQAATDSNARFLSISNSNCSGITVTASDAGASATITISAHTRNYADGTSVAVTGGSVTGLAYSTQYYIYYDQASLAGGAVAYAATTVGPDAFTTDATGAHPDRHYVASAVTPAALGAPNTGAGAIPVNFDIPPGGNWY